MAYGRKLTYRSSRTARKPAPKRRTKRRSAATSGARRNGAAASARPSVYRRISAPPGQVQRGYLPFPDRYHTRLPWVYQTGLTTPATSVTGAISYRLNGPYDPDVAAGGTQPQSWDQLAAVGYTKYRCTGAKVTITFNDPRSDNYWYGYRIRRSTEVASTGYDVQSFKMLKYTSLACMNNSGSQRRTLSFYVTPNTLFGHTRTQLLTDPNYESDIGGLPTNQLYLDVVCANLTGESVSANVIINIVYYTTLSGVNTLASS